MAHDQPPALQRFRPVVRLPTEDERALLAAVNDKAAELEALIQTVKPGRYRSLAFTALEEAVLWAVKEIANL